MKPPCQTYPDCHMPPSSRFLEWRLHPQMTSIRSYPVLRASVHCSPPSLPAQFYTLSPNYRANPVWLDPFCRNLELAAQAEHEDDLPENLSEIADLWNSPTRTHVSQARAGPGQHWGGLGERQFLATSGQGAGSFRSGPMGHVHAGGLCPS